MTATVKLTVSHDPVWHEILVHVSVTWPSLPKLQEISTCQSGFGIKQGDLSKF